MATVVALLAGTAAQASLPRDPGRSELLPSQPLTAPLPNADRLKQPRPFTLDLVLEVTGALADELHNPLGADKPRPTNRSFALFERPSRPAAGAPGPDLASALGAIEAEKLASGVEPCVLQLNIRRIMEFASISPWVTQKYAFVGWQPHMARDPMGLVADANWDPAYLEWKAKQQPGAPGPPPSHIGHQIRIIMKPIRQTTSQLWGCLRDRCALSMNSSVR